MGEPVMYLVVNTDLRMSVGKTAAQVGHGVQRLLDTVRDEDAAEALFRWRDGSYTKIVLGGTRAELDEVSRDAIRLGLPLAIVVDEGRTEIAAGAVTVVAVGPILPRSLQALNDRKLLR